MRQPKYTNEYNLIIRGEAEICSFSAADKADIDARYRQFRDYAGVRGREVIVRRRDHRIAAVACWSTLLWLDNIPSPQEVFQPKSHFESLSPRLQKLYAYLIGTKGDLAYACEAVELPVPMGQHTLYDLRTHLLSHGGIFQCDQCSHWCSTNDLTADDGNFVCEDCYHWRTKGYK